MAEMHQRIKTKLEFARESPVLQMGEHGLEKDTGQFKIGDGVTKWNALDYSSGSGKSGSNVFVVSDGEPVTLDSSISPNDTVGHWLRQDTLVNGVPFAAGLYVFMKDETSASGWSSWVLNSPSELPGPDTVAPNSPALSVIVGDTSLIAEMTPGFQSNDTTSYRARLDGGSWQISFDGLVIFEGLNVDQSYQIDAQASDASGNWSTSSTWVGFTVPPVLPVNFGNLSQGQQLANIEGDEGYNPIQWTFTTNKVPSASIDMAFRDANGTSVFIVRASGNVWEFFKTGYSGLGAMSVISGFGDMSLTLDGTTLTAVIPSNDGPQTRVGTVDFAGMIDSVKFESSSDTEWVASNFTAKVPE